jgi:hypothetical protein
MNHIKNAFLERNVEEIARYQPELITPDLLIDLMAELQAWRDIGEQSNSAETPEEALWYIQDLEEKAGQCNNEHHSNFDDYKSFFDDCVGSLNKHWPCAEPWDTNLTQVICDAITRGDVEEESE